MIKIEVKQLVHLKQYMAKNAAVDHATKFLQSVALAKQSLT